MRSIKATILGVSLILSHSVYAVESDHGKFAAELFNTMGASSGLSRDIFTKGIIAYQKTKGKKNHTLTIVDYTKPSIMKRMYVFDLKEKKLVFKTYVAHGRNSGFKYANKFSNRHKSKQTSLGVYLTNETYMGSNGYSLRLDGLTKDVNDNARARNIVVHPSSYATPSFIQKHGRLGRSWGCFAIPIDISKEVIDKIKHKGVIYVYG